MELGASDNPGCYFHTQIEQAQPANGRWPASARRSATPDIRADASRRPRVRARRALPGRMAAPPPVCGHRQLGADPSASLEHLAAMADRRDARRAALHVAHPQARDPRWPRLSLSPPQKALGAFYTPPNVARSIVDWALAACPEACSTPRSEAAVSSTRQSMRSRRSAPCIRAGSFTASMSTVRQRRSQLVDL